MVMAYLGESGVEEGARGRGDEDGGDVLRGEGRVKREG